MKTKPLFKKWEYILNRTSMASLVSYAIYDPANRLEKQYLVSEDSHRTYYTDYKFRLDENHLNFLPIPFHKRSKAKGE